VIDDSSKLLLRTIREDIQITIIPGHHIPPILADLGQIMQVIMNLSVNAQDAMPDGGSLTFETSIADLDENFAATHPETKPGQYVLLTVGDTGKGIDSETLEHIFEPFYSTKGEKGTGLGLATVYGIIKQHGGNIWVYSEPDVGTTFRIYLPVSEKAENREEYIEDSQTDLKGTETILLVEDNVHVRELSNTILNRKGYSVIVAESGEDALEILKSTNEPVHLLLTDVIMPGMNGKELYEQAQVIKPSLKALYMSGYATKVLAHRGVLNEGIQYIQKPFTVEDLSTKVRDVLDNT
jgi:CheY-like chemotaxis protein